MKNFVGVLILKTLLFKLLHTTLKFLLNNDQDMNKKAQKLIFIWKMQKKLNIL
jgi:hypothetical protein